MKPELLKEIASALDGLTSDNFSWQPRLVLT